MDLFAYLLELTQRFLPLLLTTAVVAGLLAVAHLFLNWRYADQPQGRFRTQLVMLLLTLLGGLAFVLALTRDDSELRGQLLGFLGILLSAAIALSSTTFLGNALAGILLRVVAGFRIGDFIRVGDDFGRVSERSILHTEIQTEDRDLTTLPNLYLVTHPVRVVRASGTIISATVSLGYDVPRLQVEKALLDAAHEIGLEEPFVHVLDLGDFSITYRIAGLLKEVKHLLSTRSALRTAMLDFLHRQDIEIVSPTFMNTRALERRQKILPSDSPAGSLAESEGGRSVEDLIFDKAAGAEKVHDLTDQLQHLEEEIHALEEAAKQAADDAERAAIQTRLAESQAAHDGLTRVIESTRAQSEET